MPKGYKKKQPFTLSEPSVMDEFMADYVDGSMDKQTRNAYEDYLRINPELAHDLRKIQDVRQILCGLDCRCVAPDGFQLRMKERLACEFQDDLHAGNGKSSLFVTTLVIFVLLGGVYGLYLDQSMVIPPADEKTTQVSLNSANQIPEQSVFVNDLGILTSSANNAFRFSIDSQTMPAFQLQQASSVNKTTEKDSINSLTNEENLRKLILYP